MEKVISTPSECKSEIINHLNSSSSEIKLAVAYFTDTDIAQTLVQAKARGVTVYVVVDKHEMNSQIIRYLTDNNILCKVFSTAEDGIMHQKFCIIDNEILIHGSYNYTVSASTRNKESLHITNSKKLINEYNKIFQELFPLKANNQSQHANDTKSNIDKFTDEFVNTLELIISQNLDNFNEEEIKKKAYIVAEKNNGSSQIFINNLNIIFNKMKSKINQDERTKTIIITKINNYFDNSIETLREKHHELIKIKQNTSDREKKLLTDEIRNLDEHKNKLLKTKLDIENKILTKELESKNVKEEILNIERQLIPKAFWTTPTILTIILLTIICTYLSLYFASAIWKIFFEESQIRDFLTKGITPDPPPIIDLNAYKYLFTQKGWLYTIFAFSFFIIPVILTNIKHFKKEINTYLSAILTFFGLIIIDVIIALLISKHTFETHNLLIGGNSKWTFVYAIKSIEFWLIFLFGALPLFLSKVLIDKIGEAYTMNSLSEVEKQKTIKKRQLNDQLLEIEMQKNELQLSIKNNEIETNKINEKIENINKLINEIESKTTKEIEQEQEFFISKKSALKQIADQYISLVGSGSIKILQSAALAQTAAFKNGYCEYITYYFSEAVSNEKMNTLEEEYQSWKSKTFFANETN